MNQKLLVILPERANTGGLPLQYTIPVGANPHVVALLAKSQKNHGSLLIIPYVLLVSLCTLRAICSVIDIINTYKHATLDTVDWLYLALQGLSPCKRCQASLGAPKLKLWKQKFNKLQNMPIYYKIKSVVFSVK